MWLISYFYWTVLYQVINDSYVYVYMYVYTHTHILLEYKHMRVGNFVWILFTTVAPTPKIELST